MKLCDNATERLGQLEEYTHRERPLASTQYHHHGNHGRYKTIHAPLASTQYHHHGNHGRYKRIHATKLARRVAIPQKRNRGMAINAASKTGDQKNAPVTAAQSQIWTSG